ncbi:hypothetical protein CC78DRAFT_532388 [Lojkania enalia]|uniref:Uncharacterized protein n=1 Tax=Lojkania enalia TaxID=147567 RepID=A0A9P4N704_9PLEO|nr:hypothetical protein CC78DRAFT_532388 [Didymosphaeria enalia]
MSNYAIELDQPPIQSEDCSRNLSTHGFPPIIANTITALGLAGIGNVYMDANFKREGTKWYLRALKMTNDAIVSPTEAKYDSTLLAAILLSMYESTINDKTVSAWSNHVEGSAMLIRMRGKSQFQNMASLRMYMQSLSLLSMNCIGKGETLPDFIHDLNKEFAKHGDPKNPVNLFQPTQIGAVDLRAHILNGIISDLPTIVDQAVKLDIQGKDVFDNAGDEWGYEVVRNNGNIPGVFESYYHIYTSVSAATTRNWVRYVRMYLHDIIRNALILGFSMSPPVFVSAKYIQLLQESTETLYLLQSEILASVPQQLHDIPNIMPPTTLRISTPPDMKSPKTGEKKLLWTNYRNESSPTPFISVSFAFSKDRLPVVRMSGYSVLWSIYMAGATPIATPESQQYVLKTLNRISTEFGIGQAKLLANALRAKIRLDEVAQSPFMVAPNYLPRVGWEDELT